MTREEMANVVDSAIVILKVHTLGTADLREVAAELRKTCATCQQFDSRNVFDAEVRWCMASAIEVPDDGSGFCHRWEGKP